MELIWKTAQAAAWGAAALSGLPFYARIKAEVEALCPNAHSVFMAAFPYFAGNEPGNLALYTRGLDYHRVVLSRLEGVCEALRHRHPFHNFVPAVDNSPLPEQALAILAGLGQKGEHNLLLCPPYGSFVFLGSILTDLPVEHGDPRPAAEACTHCHACRKACPTKALDASGFHRDRCLSYISQKKGELSPWEQTVLANSPRIWGCDLCQLACPLNGDVTPSPLEEFRQNLLCHLEDLDGLSQRRFKEAYGHKAFAWRGVAVLRRNLTLWNDHQTTLDFDHPPHV